MDEVTGSGFKDRVLTVKGNKYCHDMSRVELTAAKRVFFPPPRCCVFSITTFLFERLTEAELREESGSLAALLHNC